ncbi:leucyl aminopeptidase, putative [Ichthyophthirius multifiliis]|uniref:Leucyl aminopeptidase, putative n=1 Tax=Ichthyophthirius multifiliis TaxID=5932 RepID=G0R368_ICHMU|nr:leucyl aminopeptidase, putative [Ichthyophthirius multifiliis]EGR28091.1 leucyl aminopeptidase, putative [Ichthyophthirius multifiliis]|eukprot:XP_004027436.1 leucyl aminopeptidase, putative [Ichthyophthirius multifiliis]
MKRHIPFDYTKDNSLIPTYTSQKGLPQQKIQALVSVLSDKDLENHPAYLSQHLKNTHLVTDLKKSVQTLFGLNDDLFEICYVTYIQKTECPNEQYKTGQALSKFLIEKKFKDLNLVFSENFSSTFFPEFFYGLTMHNWKNELKSYPEDEENNNFKPFQKIHVFSPNFSHDDQQFQSLQKIALCNIQGRNLLFTRANIATPEYMLNWCQNLVQQHKDKMQIEYIKGQDLEKKGLNLIWNVGKGSANTPNLTTVCYWGNPENKNDVYGLVGKGVCFDSGGLSLKQQLMEKMYQDKGGACTALAVLNAVVNLNLKINIVCTLGFVENFISSNCYRNSDIITSYKGITVEVLNTDAEGRLVLADCLAYQQDVYKPHTIFDFATLTGACIVALGGSACGLFSTDDDLANELHQLSKQSHQLFWRLPLDQFPRENTLNPTADIQNLGKVGYAGSGTAAAFLEKFVEKNVKWAHIDIAGTVLFGNDVYGVRTILEYYKKRI